MTLFFVLIFIAEIKLTADLIGCIKRFDQKVCEANLKITQFQPRISDSFISIRIVINTVLLNINKTKVKIAEKKDEYKFILLKHIITTALFLILNIKGKQAMTVVELLLSARKFTKSAIKLAHSLKN